MDVEECKMFVGGLTRDTTGDMLRVYFNGFGRVMHAVVMTNPETQKSRGFGFVTFDHPEVVDRVLMNGPHYLDGKQIDPKPSVPKDLRPKPPQVEQPKKAFLGGLPLEMNEADLREFFSSYGVVTECYIMFDEKRMKPRGFGFVSFEDDSIVDGLVSQHFIDVRGKRVEVKLARPRENPLAPLNSEGRVLSVETQQQRMAATAAAAAAAARPRPAQYGGEWQDYYAPPRRPQPWHDAGPPAAKRPRTGACQPQGYPPMGQQPDYDRRYGYQYDASDRRPAYSERAAPDAGRERQVRMAEHASTAPKASISSASSAAVSQYLDNFASNTSSNQSTVAADPSSMTPESVTALMQQAMQNMSGVGMKMMMPMVMSNMMTQMFMSQAQTMFQSVIKQQKTPEQGATNKPINTEGDAPGTSINSNMMEVMKNVLQTLMSNSQQRQTDSKASHDQRTE